MKALSGHSVVTVGLAITLTVLAAAALAAQTDRVDAAAGTHWEHLALTQDGARVGSDREISRQIVKLGNDGWELVTVSTLVEEGTTVKTVFYFKRPK